MAQSLTPDIQYYGDSGLLVSYDNDGFSETTCDTVFRLSEVLRESDDWTNVVPAYDSLLITFNPMYLDIASAKEKIETALSSLGKAKRWQKKTPIDIPVYYGGDNGPDMATICESSKLSEDKVIKRHSKIIYRVCMMGFVPGFAFLSETDKKLHHPRHQTPKDKVPAGSIGIANWQTGIYGLESPAGWQIIGRTPMTIFDPYRETPFLLKAGDHVRFIPTGEV